MMDLTAREWVKHAVTHPVEGFEDMRWKKAGSLKITAIIVLLWFAAAIFRDRLYGFQFYTVPDKLFNVVPYIVQTIVLFLTWVVGNWAVCTLLDGEGTMRNICIYSAYALIPYVAGIYLQVLLSHILIRDELVFIQAVSECAARCEKMNPSVNGHGKGVRLFDLRPAGKSAYFFLPGNRNIDNIREKICKFVESCSTQEADHTVRNVCSRIDIIIFIAFVE